MRKSTRKHLNAEKHAVFSRFLIIDGEDPHEFQEFVDDVAEEWQPEGSSEHDAAFELVKGIWFKRRVQLFFRVEGEKNARNPDHPAYDEGLGLEAFLASAKMSPKDFFLAELISFAKISSTY